MLRPTAASRSGRSRPPTSRSSSSCAWPSRRRRSACPSGAWAPEELAALEGRLAEMAHFAEAKDYVRWASAAQRAFTAP